MDLFLKISAGILLVVVLYLALIKQGKDIALLLTILTCCMVAAAAVQFLQPVIDLLKKLESVGKLNTDMVGILLKSVGIGLISEIICLTCTDAGNSSLGKTLQILSSAVIIWMSLPLFDQLLELVESILSAI